MDAFDLRTWNGFIKSGGDSASAAVIDQVAIDSRRIDSHHALFVALKGTEQDGHHYITESRAKYALVKTGWIPPSPTQSKLLYVDDPLQAFQEIASCYRQKQKAKIIAVTGSYGKTMVKDLLQSFLNTTFNAAASPESFNSQIGVPLSLLQIKQVHDVAVIETGFSEKGELENLAHIIKPEFAILTHVGKKHHNTLGNRASIASEMNKFLQKIPKEGWILLPQDPNFSTDSLQASLHFWNVNRPDLPHASHVASNQDTFSLAFPDETSYKGNIRTGFYYYLDLLNITSKAAWLMGVPALCIQKVLDFYIPEPTRTEIWKSSLGTTFINEPYCSDPQSINPALKLLKSTSQGRKIFFFGGLRASSSEQDYKHVGAAINAAGIDAVYLHGNHAFSSLQKVLSPKTQVHQLASFEEILKKYKTELKNDDTVLVKGSHKEPLEKLMETYQESVCTNQWTINFAAMRENIATLRTHLPTNTRVMVMVKAMAYGTDDIRIAQFLQTCGVDILGVSYVDEGIALRRAGVKQAVFVINSTAFEAAKIVKWNLEVGVSDASVIEALGKEAVLADSKVKVHLHIDTGMSRFGCRPEEALHFFQKIQSYPSLILEGVMTHFACADDPEEDAFTRTQIAAFDQVIDQLPISIPWKHAANSSGTIRFNLPQYNMVRVGLAVYGLYASPYVKKQLELKLAVSLISRIVGINICKAGETISYGRGYTVQKHTQRIAVLPIGYFDGLHRNYSGKGHVLIRGQKAPMVGKICMDFMMVDISDIPNASLGDPVLIFGEDEYGYYASPEDFATQGGSIIHELITCLGPRIQRLFVYEETNEKSTTIHN